MASPSVKLRRMLDLNREWPYISFVITGPSEFRWMLTIMTTQPIGCADDILGENL